MREKQQGNEENWQLDISANKYFGKKLLLQIKFSANLRENFSANKNSANRFFGNLTWSHFLQYVVRQFCILQL
jgi:hypothetical protein